MRAGSAYDREWRREFAHSLYILVWNGVLRILDPYSWQEVGTRSDGKQMVDTDFHGIDRSDVVVFNLTGLTENYPCIGTLVELGRTTAAKKLVYVIMPKGHTFPVEGVPGLHPFIKHNATAIFETEDECLDYLIDVLPQLERSGGEHAVHFSGTA
ncbi:MAG: hypothetical protein CV089_02320 [Nitrospira sp. WS110]|nr:hypothetical protein [Nitrospira sp. WS110]